MQYIGSKTGDEGNIAICSKTGDEGSRYAARQVKWDVIFKLTLYLSGNIQPPKRYVGYL